MFTGCFIFDRLLSNPLHCYSIPHFQRVPPYGTLSNRQEIEFENATVVTEHDYRCDLVRAKRYKGKIVIVGATDAVRFRTDRQEPRIKKFEWYYWANASESILPFTVVAYTRPPATATGVSFAPPRTSVASG